MHWLYIMPFDRLLAALVLIKYMYMDIFVAILLSNYQKACFICLSSALVSQSINTCRIQVSFKSISYTFTILATIHHNLSRFEQDGKIEAHWD